MLEMYSDPGEGRSLIGLIMLEVYSDPGEGRSLIGLMMLEMDSDPGEYLCLAECWGCLDNISFHSWNIDSFNDL